MKCEFCKQEKPDVQVRQDPFDWVVNEAVWHVPMCSECEQTRFDDS